MILNIAAAAFIEKKNFFFIVKLIIENNFFKVRFVLINICLYSKKNFIFIQNKIIIKRRSEKHIQFNYIFRQHH